MLLVLSEPELFMLPAFHVPNFITLFHYLDCPKGSVQTLRIFRNKTSFR